MWLAIQRYDYEGDDVHGIFKTVEEAKDAVMDNVQERAGDQPWTLEFNRWWQCRRGGYLYIVYDLPVGEWHDNYP